VQDAARACKAGLVATAVIAVSVVGHLAVGGAAHLLSPTFPISLILVYAVLLALPVRTWSARVLIPLLVVSQVLLHFGMQLGMQPRLLLNLVNPPADAMSAMTGSTNTTHSMASYSTTSMVLAHAAAIVVAYVLIRRGDRMIDALLLLLGAVVPVLTTPPTLVVIAGAPATRSERVVVLRPAFLIADVVRRGPPAVLPTPRARHRLI